MTPLCLTCRGYCCGDKWGSVVPHKNDGRVLTLAPEHVRVLTEEKP
jgi:hypothetical protein